MFLWINNSRTPSYFLVLCSRKFLPWCTWCSKSNVDILRWQSTCRYHLILLYPPHSILIKDIIFEISIILKFLELKFFFNSVGLFSMKIRRRRKPKFHFECRKWTDKQCFKNVFKVANCQVIQKYRFLKLLKLVHKRHFFVQNG